MLIDGKEESTIAAFWVSDGVDRCRVGSCHPLEVSGTGFGNQFIFGYEVEVELSIQLKNGNEVEYE